MLNVAIIMGRLCGDPELKMTASGNSVVAFTVAVDRSYAKQGEERKADFIKVIAWNKTAEFISQYFRKGSMIAVQGRIQTRSYEDKNGNKREAVELVASEVSFCGSKKDDSDIRAAAPNFSGNASVADFIEIPSDDDLPF